MLYKIYAGLDGGFGGATYQYTKDFESEEDAMDAAYKEAISIYESYEGCGVFGYEDFVAMYMEDNDIQNEDDIPSSRLMDEYNSEIESWIDYYVEITDTEEDGE